DIHERLTRTARSIAESAGATADVKINLGYPVTRNDNDLTAQMVPTLARVAGENYFESPRNTGAEDFSYFAEAVPGMFFFLGVAPEDPALVAPNHSPKFYADERALPVGVTAMTALVLDYLEAAR
ncbi:MAG: M20/M25/M40 family metallo-hydrolase, partial [Pseudomonadales bacterium]